MNAKTELRIPADRSDVNSPTKGAIDVWLTFYDQLSEEWCSSRYWDLLSFEEKEQQQRFHFARDRQRYLVTRALVRTVLSRYAALDPREWIFSPNAWGRPEIANSEMVDRSLCFNVSHTRGLIALSVTRARAIGLDVENFLEREAPVEIADRYFSAQEVAVLRGAPSAELPYRFFEYWTFKEAYIKARGMGLSLPLDKFSFSYPDTLEVAIEIDPELNDPADRWQFWQFSPAPGYLLALCAERPHQALADQPVALRVYETVPGVKESEMAVDLLRRSL